jgi:hypothetical protein
LAFRHAIPTICPYREFAAAGGLVSYGTNISARYNGGVGWKRLRQKQAIAGRNDAVMKDFESGADAELVNLRFNQPLR